MRVKKDVIVLLNKFRYLLAKWLKRIANRLYHSENNFDLIPKGQYDYVPKGTYVFGPADQFLLVPKNRYRATLLPNKTISDDLGIGWITEDNSAKSYDQLWGNESNLEVFRAEAEHVRDKLTVEIIDCIEKYLFAEAKVIDIGCGVGDLLAEAHKRQSGINVSGLDFSGKAIEGARRSFPDGNFVQHIIEKSLPFESCFYDVVFCTDVLEHLEHPKLVVAELVRICCDGGLVAIVVPDGDVDQFLGHYWFWNESSLKNLLGNWNAEVSRLPVTREFIACINVSHPE